MSFLYPSVLFGLGAISIPIIIHLFNFRRYKVVYFSSTEFLKEVKEETKSARNIKNLLVLICRILAISALVLAFSQPFIESDGMLDGTGSSAYGIYIDNSLSMESRNTSGVLLERAKQYAYHIINGLYETDDVQILSNEFQGRQQRLYHPSEASKLVETTDFSPFKRNFNLVMNQHYDALSGVNSTKRVYIISDFQEINYVVPEMPTDSGWQLVLVPVSPESDHNVYIDSCWFETPVRKVNETEVIRLRIVNNGHDDLTDVPMNLFINGQLKTPSSFSVAAESFVDTAIYYNVRSPGVKNCHLELSDFPVTFDDRFYFNYEIPKTIRALCIFDRDSFPGLSKLFKNDPGFLIRQNQIKTLDYSKVSTFNTIIIYQCANLSSGLMNVLKEFQSLGGNLVIIPEKFEFTDSEDLNHMFMELSGVQMISNDTLNYKVSSVLSSSDIFTGVFDFQHNKNAILDLPATFGHYQLKISPAVNHEVIMTLENDDPWMILLQTKAGGSTLVFSSPLDKSSVNFQRHALFVPVFYNFILQSQISQKLFYTIGLEPSINLNRNYNEGEQILKIKSLEGDFEFLPQVQGNSGRFKAFTQDHILEPGHFLITDSKQDTTYFSFNFNRTESLLKSKDLEQIKSDLNQKGINTVILSGEPEMIGSTIREMSQGTLLWKYFIIMAIAFLICEILVIKLYSRKH